MRPDKAVIALWLAIRSPAIQRNKYFRIDAPTTTLLSPGGCIFSATFEFSTSLRPGTNPMTVLNGQWISIAYRNFRRRSHVYNVRELGKMRSKTFSVLSTTALNRSSANGDHKVVIQE
jgi:hypothetical protein